MRKKRNPQCRLNFAVIPHPICEELSGISQWLDAHPQFIDLALDDLKTGARHDTGRKALSVESVLRIALLRQYLQCDYDYLSFTLMDSMVHRHFCRLEANQKPCKSSLQSLVSRLTAETWEAINRGLLTTAQKENIERGRTVAIDSTVTASDIKMPYDSDLLADAIKEMCRCLQKGQDLTVDPLYQFTFHKRAVKQAAKSCSYASRKDEQKPHYKKLLQLARKTKKTLMNAASCIKTASHTSDCDLFGQAENWLARVDELIPLVDTIISQTERRVFQGEKVPAQEKIVSLYEPHTDIIVKDRRQVQYGHKLNLTQGKSRLILDLVIETGNPADAERFVPMIERQQEIYGRVPRQSSVDGGYASKANLEEVKAMGVKDAAFHKKRGLAVEDMTKSEYVYKTLCRFRAGIEAGISWLKRCFGLSRCRCKGTERFDAWCWSGVVCYNLVILARQPAPS